MRLAARGVIATLATALALMVSGAAAANASITWHTNFLMYSPAWDGEFTAHGGPSSLRGSYAPVNCTSADADNELTAASATVPLAWDDAVDGTVTFNRCAVAGVIAGFGCNYELTINGKANGPDGGTSYLTSRRNHIVGYTSPSILNCVLTVAGRPNCTITGTLNWSYDVPGTVTATRTGTDGRLDLLATTSGLTVVSVPPMTCLLGAGTGSFGGLSLPLSSGSPQPVIW